MKNLNLSELKHEELLEVNGGAKGDGWLIALGVVWAFVVGFIAGNNA
ncbi:MAG: hypothetical protein Tsb0034_10730 [Ekhidna sp.]